MSKHIDLIAVAALLLAFAFAERVHGLMQVHLLQARVFRMHAIRPLVISPPQVPAVPRLPHLPRV